MGEDWPKAGGAESHHPCYSSFGCRYIARSLTLTSIFPSTNVTPVRRLS